jgi:hypothetical protein
VKKDPALVERARKAAATRAAKKAAAAAPAAPAAETPRPEHGAGFAKPVTSCT